MRKAQLRKLVAQPFLSFQGVALVSLIAIMALVSACLSVLLESRHELIRRADMMASNVLVLADQTVEIEVGRYETRLLDIIAELHHASLAGDGAMPTGDELFGGAALRNSLGDMIVVGAHGTVLTSSRPDLTPRYTAVLPRILQNLGRDPGEIGVSTIPLGGEMPPLIALARRCAPGACGSALGVVTMLPMSWIQGVFDDIQLGRSGAIALVDGNGILLAREPPIQRRVGQTVERPALLNKVPRGRFIVFEKRSSTDGLNRRITAGWVGTLPLIVFVGISTADILNGWTGLAAVTILALVILCAALVALTVLLARQIRRKTQVDRKLLSANTKLAELAHTDPLTGLLNRRGFDDTLSREWRRCRRSGKPLSLLMIDADSFKQYNDHFGHQAGDGVLRALADVIMATIRRPGDIGARYGGEEFSVVLPETDMEAACRIAELIRGRIEELAMPHPEAGTVVTVSIGVSHALPGPSGSPDELLAVADAALYESKALGRNRMTVGEVTPQPADEQARG